MFTAKFLIGLYVGFGLQWAIYAVTHQAFSRYNSRGYIVGCALLNFLFWPICLGYAVINDRL